MTIEELNDLVAKEATKITEANWFNEIVQVIERILKDHDMIPDDMVLHWARHTILRDWESVVLYLPETADAFTLFSVPTYKPPLDKHNMPKCVTIYYALFDIYAEHRDIQAAIDKAVIALYIDKTNREVREYEERNKPL